MTRPAYSHPFWGDHSPLVVLSGGGLLIMAGTRTAFALVIAAALLWVYGLTVSVFCAAARVIPLRGRPVVLVFLSGFLGSLFLLFTWLFDPLLALELGFLISLTPVCCIGSGIFTRIDLAEPGQSLARALAEAAVLGLLILALALIREPLGRASLSLPGGPEGIMEIAAGGEEDSFFPVRIAASSAGGLLLLGYGLALFRRLRSRYAGRGDNP